MKKNILFVLTTVLCSIFSIAPQPILAASIHANTITPNATVSAGTTITFQIEQSGLSNPYYILSDSLPGSTLANSNISTAGRFEWTSSQADIGTHTITIIGVDKNGYKASFTQTLVIRDPSFVSIKNLSPGPSIVPNNIVSFGVVALGYANPTFRVVDSFSGSSLTSSNIDSYGNFGWKPKSSDVGVHNLAIIVRSGSREDIVYQTITVNGISTDKTKYNIVVGENLTLPILTYGLKNASYRVGDSLPRNTTDMLTINGNTLSWTPQEQDYGIHTLTITAIDGSDAHIHKIEVDVHQNGTTNNTGSDVVPGYTVTTSAPSVSNSSNYKFYNALNIGSVGKDVIELQKRLTIEGFYSGPTNGSYGPLTQTAVKKYQSAHGISPLGNVGPSTRASLNK